jgi:hypothetical protein
MLFGGQQASGSAGILQLYSRQAPSPAAPFDIFKDDWSSEVPGFKTGASPLFDDSRIKWLESQLGSFEGKRVLELGPLEGGHTFMMERAGATVTAIEANQRAFLKCLIVKDAFHLKSEFLFGDFRPYLSALEPGSFMGARVRFNPKPLLQTVGGISAEVYEQHYLSSGGARFCGGSAPTSCWLTREGLLQTVTNLGFDLTIGEENPLHPNGPCILLYARRI